MAGQMSNYEEIRSVGKGSFGDVWLVRRKKDDRQFVLKKMHVGKTEKEREACQLEIKLLERLEHPGVVEYVESFQIPKTTTLCIVMAFCEGGDLTNFLKKRRNVKLSEKEILDFFIQMALALHFMHERNIMHRDLKTQNVFLKNGALKLGDFGISKILDTSMDFAQTCIGTPYYMSPELFKNKPYNFKSDVWALGCVLYELTTFKHAFDAQSLNGLAGKIVKGQFAPISPSYSKNLRTLISSMLNVNSADRPSMEQILRLPFVRQRCAAFVQDLMKSGPSAVNPREWENLKKQLKSLQWDDMLVPAESIPAQPSSGAAAAAHSEVLRKQISDQQARLQEEEAQRANLEAALKRLRDESKARAAQRDAQQQKQAGAPQPGAVKPPVPVQPKPAAPAAPQPQQVQQSAAALAEEAKRRAAAAAAAVKAQAQAPAAPAPVPSVAPMPPKKVAVIGSKEQGGAAAANAIQAALAANGKQPSKLPIIQSSSAPNSARGSNSDGGVSAIAAAVGPAVQAQSDMLRRQKEREEELRRKRDEEAKRVAELEAWEAEKRRKLKEERDRVQKMKQLADEAERKAAEDRRRSEAEAYQRQLADRMAQEQAELNEIRKQREALQKKLQAFESEKRAAYQSPAKQSESSNPKVKVVAAAAPPVPSLSRNNSGSSVGSGSGSGKLPDAFSVKPPGAAGVPSRKPVPLAPGPVIAASAVAHRAADDMSAKDRVLREKERRKREEEERRQSELAAARNEYGSQRGVAVERNKAMYRGSQSASTSPRRLSAGGMSETARLEADEQYDHFEIDDETVAEEEEAVHELENELRHYTQHIDHMRSSLRESELRLALQDDEVLDAVEEDEEYREEETEIPDDPELIESLADRFNRLKEFCQNGLGRDRFTQAYSKLRMMRQHADGVQDDVLEMELLVDILGDDDAHRFAKPLDQLYFIESNFI